jgi:extradiol dioxygenase family protein
MNARPRSLFDFFDVAHLSPNGTAHKAHNCVDFVIAPNVRFKGEAGEQTLNDNAFEFKAFHDETRIFAQ